MIPCIRRGSNSLDCLSEVGNELSVKGVCAISSYCEVKRVGVLVHGEVPAELRELGVNSENTQTLSSKGYHTYLA